MPPIIRLKPKREKSACHKHPWIFSGAIASQDENPSPGETVAVLSSEGDFLGWGAYSPNSQIRVRFWNYDEQEPIDSSFFQDRLKKALALRTPLLAGSNNNAFRVVYAESDDLPGLIVDKYADYLVVQFLSAGAEAWRTTIVESLMNLLKPKGIFERSDVAVRKLEGLQETEGVLAGLLPPDRLEIKENTYSFWVDIKQGQKTGFYLDQRDNRQKSAENIAGKSILNCFSYSGGFTVYALANSASHVLSIDSSADALELAKENVQLNNLPLDRCDWLAEDVFVALRHLRDRALSFERIILDPPKFAPVASQAQKAARAYKDINLLAFKLLKPNGELFTFSCSGGIDLPFFQKIVSDAALDAGVNAKIIDYLHQAPDHPISLNFPEGNYLKGLVCKIV